MEAKAPQALVNGSWSWGRTPAPCGPCSAAFPSYLDQLLHDYPQFFFLMPSSPSFPASNQPPDVHHPESHSLISQASTIVA